tara:strand:- start:47 stop:256 length:210 start_codon:yes stop_codon:yes gene_type:complete
MSIYLTEVEVRNILVSGIVESLRSIPKCPENADESTKRFYNERTDSIKDDLSQLKESTLYMLHNQLKGI